MKQTEKWFLVGDLHGTARLMEYFYRKVKHKIDFDSTKVNMILLGDVCCNYFLNKSDRDKKYKEKLSALPFNYICLRGNHEARVTDAVALNPDRWKKKMEFGGITYVEKKFPSIHYLEDVPALYNFGGYKTLSLPGAYSIDKWYRINNKLDWFENEQLTEEEMEAGLKIINDTKKVDLVISHTCPYKYEPRELFLSYINQETVDKTMEKYLDKIEDSLDYRRWAYGHYHADILYDYNEQKDCQRIMLFNQIVDLDLYMKTTKESQLQDISILEN